MTYAHHQEAASRALRDLLTDPTPTDRTPTDHTPTEEESIALVLACRDQARGALRERLRYLGDGNDHPNTQPFFQVAAIAHHPLHQLSRVLDGIPRTEPTAVPPSTLLPGPPATSATSTLDRWRCVARNLLLGTAELTRADHQPWTHQAEAGWFLVADAACTIEAILVLDHTLAKHGALPAVAEPTLLTQRLVAGDVAKMARWYGTDNIADHAHAGIKHQLGLAGAPPITMIRRPVDYATAQRTLTALLNGEAATSRPGTDQRPGIKAARALATGQSRLAQAFAHQAEHDAGDPRLADQFRARVPALRALHVSTTRLTEIVPRRSALLLTQQSEMLTQLRTPNSSRLTRSELLDLNDATHQVTLTIGRALRREATQTHNIVALDASDPGLPTPQPITSTGWAFISACRQLTEDPAPTDGHQPVPAPPIERERLRLALDSSVLGKPPAVRRMTPSVTGERPYAGPPRDPAPRLHL